MSIENYLEAVISNYQPTIKKFAISDLTPESIEAMLVGAAIVFNLVDDLDLQRKEHLPCMEVLHEKGKGIVEMANSTESIEEYLKPVRLAYGTLETIHANHSNIFERLKPKISDVGIAISIKQPETEDTISKDVALNVFDAIAGEMVSILLKIMMDLITFANTCEFVLERVEEYSESQVTQPNLTLVH